MPSNHKQIPSRFCKIYLFLVSLALSFQKASISLTYSYQTINTQLFFPGSTCGMSPWYGYAYYEFSILKEFIGSDDVKVIPVTHDKKANANNEKPYFRISLCLPAVGILFILVKCN